MQQFPRFSFQGVQICQINQEKANSFLTAHESTVARYVCFPDSYTVFSGAKDPKLLSILNSAWFTMPDGKPLELYARRKGIKEVSTVSGYWTCKALLQKHGSTHYFYGSRPEVLANLQAALEKEFPEATILGYKSPPFIELDAIESSEQIKQDIDEIAALQPDYLWIGLSSPKQDYLMHHYYQVFNKTILLGVGGVFEYLSGDVKKSPEWIKKLGLRWLYRLLKEPRRLFSKYMFVLKSYLKVIFSR